MLLKRLTTDYVQDVDSGNIEIGTSPDYRHFHTTSTSYQRSCCRSCLTMYLIFILLQ